MSDDTSPTLAPIVNQPAPSRDDVEQFISQLSTKARRAFDPAWDPETGSRGLTDEELRERVAFYLTSRGEVNLRAAHKARPVIANVTGDGDEVRSHEMQRRHAAALKELMPDGDDAEALRRYQQRQRRAAAINELAMQLLTRQEPTVNVEFITVQQLDDLMKDYKQAREEGFTDSQVDWQPLSAYAPKLFPTNRKPVRLLLENECGLFSMGSDPMSPLRGRITCVRDRDLGTGGALDSHHSHVVVPDTVTPTVSPDDETNRISSLDFDMPTLLPGPNTK